MPEDKKAVRLVVQGQVQGVGYRAWAVRVANSLGLMGWVRNLPDKTVEIQVAGPLEIVDSFIVLCQKGPARAHVGNVLVQNLENPFGFGPIFEQR